MAHSSDFVLRAQLQGHSNDVRNVLNLSDSKILSVSRDQTSKIWEEKSGGFDLIATLSGHAGFVNSCCEIAPLENLPNGGIATGSSDKLILVWEKERYFSSKYTLCGHTDTVSSLSSSPDGMLLSTSWDHTAIVWDMKTASMKFQLQGHTHAVHCGCILQTGQFVTGGADNVLKLWDQSGHFIRDFVGHTLPVRRIIDVPGFGILSCSNDGDVRLWDYSGECLHLYQGHQEYVYGITLINGIEEFATSSEDHTINIWRAGQCIQTIAHPCSVWSVEIRVNTNGVKELISAGSDGVVRVWTRDSSVAATPEQLELYHELLISENQESKNASKPADVPETVNGVHYDHIIPVTLSDGTPPLYLGHNNGENPWISAKRFLQQNQLPFEYEQQIADFIQQNCPTYVPPKQFEQQSVEPKGPPPIFPLLEPIGFSNLNSLTQLHHRIILTNSQLNEPQRLNAADLQAIDSIVKTVKDSARYHSSSFSPSYSTSVFKLLDWPEDVRFPCCDLVRAILVHPKSGTLFSDGQQLIQSLIKAGVNPEATPKNFLTAAQALTNLFCVPNRFFFSSLLEKREIIINTLSDCLEVNTLFALKPSVNTVTTILLNFASLFHNNPSNQTSDAKIQCASILLNILQKTDQLTEETQFRGFVAIGTLITQDNNVKEFLSSMGIEELINNNYPSDRLQKCVELIRIRFASQ